MTETFDRAALSDALRNATPDPTHNDLRRVLGSFLPGREILIGAHEGSFARGKGLCRRDGTPLDCSRDAWIEAHLAAADGRVQDAAARLVADDLLVVEESVRQWFIRVPGASQAEGLQITVVEARPFAVAEAAGNAAHAAVSRVSDLEWHDRPLAAPQPVGPARYELERMDWLEDLLRSDPTANRFVADWLHSSASDKVRLCEHWAFDVCTTGIWAPRAVVPRPVSWPEDPAGAPLSLGGRWTNDAEMAASLTRFDEACGYAMAWYFHSIYGNCASIDTLREVADAVDRRAIVVPHRDAEVVRGWASRPYAF